METHPYGSFVPTRARFLLLGSFPGKPEAGNDWFYSNRRNQFWSILESVYNLRLDTKKSKQKLFTRLKIAITDIVYQCERLRGTNLDSNLVNIVYNTQEIEKLLRQNKIQKVYFSSRYVENKFKRLFGSIAIDLITLPSPSPRYAAMTKEEKIKRYRNVLPKLK